MTPKETTSANGVLPVEQYVANLPRKRMAAGVVFRDAQGRILLQETSYKADWEVPGGVVEAGESPWAAASREVIEELGVDRPLGRLLVVDYVRPQDNRPEGVVFLFDGGLLGETDLAEMVLGEEEIRSVAFCAFAEARARTKPLLADRLAAAVEAAEQGVTVLCEQGHRVA